MENSPMPEVTNVQILEAIQGLGGKVESLEGKIGNLENSVGNLKESVGSLEKSVGSLENSVGSLEKSVGSLEKSVGNLEGKVGSLERSVGNLEGRVGGLEGRIGSLEGKVESLEGKVDSLERKTDILNEKIDENYDELMLTIHNQSVHMDEEFSRVRNEMASKDHLDRKVDGLEVSIGGSLRQVDRKDTALVESLLVKKIISSQESENLITMSPFPVHA